MMILPRKFCNMFMNYSFWFDFRFTIVSLILILFHSFPACCFFPHNFLSLSYSLFFSRSLYLLTYSPPSCFLHPSSSATPPSSSATPPPPSLPPPSFTMSLSIFHSLFWIQKNNSKLTQKHFASHCKLIHILKQNYRGEWPNNMIKFILIPRPIIQDVPRPIH